MTDDCCLQQIVLGPGAGEDAPAPATPAHREAIRALTRELRQTDLAQAVQHMDRFRPLCDADGYPVVGNVMTKAVPEPAPEAVAFCAEVRARAGARARR